MLTQHAVAVERKLFWRFKANAQRAARDGDFKYLKILDNTFLFNVVEDPMERANLKVRRMDVYDRIVAEWHEWNATMLPEIDDSRAARRTILRHPKRRRQNLIENQEASSAVISLVALYSNRGFDTSRAISDT